MTNSSKYKYTYTHIRIHTHIFMAALIVAVLPKNKLFTLYRHTTYPEKLILTREVELNTHKLTYTGNHAKTTCIQ